MPQPEDSKQRLFFALWPDDEVRQSIARVAKQATEFHQGRVMRTDNLHLTLAFLGNVNEQQQECVETMASTVSMTPFNLCLDHVGIFQRPKVLWLGIKEKLDPLMQLAASLGKGAKDCGIKLDDKVFNPHVTLMRKVNCYQDMKIESIHWYVNNFCLVKSVLHPDGVEYRVVKQWP